LNHKFAENLHFIIAIPLRFYYPSASMKDIRLAIIGCGVIGNVHLKHAQELGLSVAFTVDPNLQRARQAAEAVGCQAYESLQAAFEDGWIKDPPGAAIIASPPGTRAETLELCLSKGIGVLIEKPLGRTEAEALELVSIAERYPAALAVVGFCHRFAPVTDVLRSEIQKGTLGTPVCFENTFVSFSPHQAHNWMSDPQISGGGSLIDTACHSLDLFEYLFGPATLVGAVRFSPWDNRGEAAGTLLLRNEDTLMPVAGVIRSGWLEPPRYTLKLIGTHASLYYDYEEGSHIQVQTSDNNRYQINVGDPALRYRRQLDAFLAAVVHPQSPDRFSCLMTAARINRLLDTACREPIHL
jgi:predicted dehydrogenase